MATKEEMDAINKRTNKERQKRKRKRAMVCATVAAAMLIFCLIQDNMFISIQAFAFSVLLCAIMWLAVFLAGTTDWHAMEDRE